MSCGTFWPFISGRNTGFWNTRSSGTMPALQDFAAAVDVAEVGVDRLDALLQPAAQRVPFLRRQDARDDVERDQPLLGVGLAIDREGDADAAEQQLGFLAAIVQHVGADIAEPAGQFGIGRPDLAVRPLHLIERQAHRLHSPNPPGLERPRPARVPHVDDCKPRANRLAGVKGLWRDADFGGRCLKYGQGPLERIVRTSRPRASPRRRA